MAVVEVAMRAILAAVEASATVTDEQLSMLNFLFEKNLERALRILDQGGVQRVTSEPSHHTVFQCKHQLAAKLANALHMCKEVTMSDEELAYLLLEC